MPEIPRQTMAHALEAIAHGQGYGPGERKRYRNDDELMVELIYPAIRKQVITEVEEALTEAFTKAQAEPPDSRAWWLGVDQMVAAAKAALTTLKEEKG